jgi:hypothetical protein
MDPREMAELMKMPEPVAYPASDHDSHAQYTAEQMCAYALAHKLYERDKWRKVLAESCDDYRSQMMGEAGSSGGCSRAVAAEACIDRLRAAALAALDVLDSYEAEAHAADRLRAALAGLGA